jgi:TolA-binding protein
MKTDPKLLLLSCVLSVCALGMGADAPPSFAQAQPVPASVSPGAETTDAADNSGKPAAPQILEEQLIENSMDVAMGLYHAEDYAGVARVTRNILQSYPKREKKLYRTAYLLALAEEHSGQYADAVVNYLSVVKNKPNSGWSNAAQFRVGICQKAMGNDLEAINTFRDIIDFNPRSEYRLQAFVHLGSLYRSQGNWKPAVHIYRDMIRLYPCSEWSWLAMQYLAEAYQRQDKEDEARQLYRRFQQDPCTPRGYAAQAQLRIAEMYLNRGDYQEALNAYMQALDTYSDVPGIKVYAEEKAAQARQGRSEMQTFKVRHRNVDLSSPDENP